VSAFVYALFISLSALRLNVRLCIFTGAVAGVEYALLAVYFINKTAERRSNQSSSVSHTICSNTRSRNTDFRGFC
jgi:hypothetical protein